MSYHKIKNAWKGDPEDKFKTRIENGWSLPEFEYLQNAIWECREKVDGSNLRVMWDYESKKVEFAGKSKNIQLRVPAFLYLEKIFPLSLFEANFPDVSVILYGELVGPKLNGNSYRLAEEVFILFDIFIGGFWLEQDNITDVAEKFFIPQVKVFDMNLKDAIDFVRLGFDSYFRPGVQAEGLVCLPKVALFNRWNERVICKLKTKTFKELL